MTKIRFGFSSCPNDTYIFDALVNNKVDTEGIDFEIIVADVEDLNKKAFKQELDVTKISFAAFTKLANSYLLLDSGSALGKNCGPILISKKKHSIADISTLKIAVPGFNTTANMLCSIAFPLASKKSEMIFSDIEESVLKGDTDAGLIIHENPNSAYEYMRIHAQEMKKEIMYKHVNLYVNNYSLNLGKSGRKSVQLLFEHALKLNYISKIPNNIFLT